jgi:predicted transcriptional regulator
MKVKWTTDHQAESMMNQFGVDFTVKTVDTSDIDWKASKANGARLHSELDQNLVADYKSAMENGDEFPMIVLLKRRREPGLLILGGNHRANSVVEVGDKTLKAYLIESDDTAVVEILPRVLNRMHGKRQDRETAMEHAIYAIEHFGYEQKQAAKLFGLTRQALSSEILSRTAKTELEKKGIDCRPIAKTTLKNIGRINNENVQMAAARIIAGQKLGVVAADEIIEEVRKNKTEATQMAVIADWEKRMYIKDPGPAVKIPRNKRTVFLTWLSTGENLVQQAKFLEQFQITESGEQDKVKKRLLRISGTLKSIAAANGKRGHADISGISAK